MIPTTQPPEVPVPYIGQPVHYVEPTTGLHRPAITLNTFQNSDLWVFSDTLYFVKQVQMGTEHELGTWHFIQEEGV